MILLLCQSLAPNNDRHLLSPQLTKPPANTRALSFLSSVAGEALTKHLNKILQALMVSMSEKQNTPDEEQVANDETNFAPNLKESLYSCLQCNKTHRYRLLVNSGAAVLSNCGAVGCGRPGRPCGDG